MNYKEYEFDSWALARVNEGVVPQLPAGVTLASLTEMVSGFGRNLGAPDGTVRNWVAPNLAAFADLFNIYSGTGLFELSGASNANARGNIRSVTEKDSAAYLQLDFNTELAGVPVRGDIGVRYVKTRQSSTGYRLASGAAQQTTIDRDYDDVLPALNVTAEITPDFLVRFGAAKVMTRPNLGSVTPGGSVNTNGVYSVSLGNPYLNPIRATTYDFSAEWYFAPDALVSVGLFLQGHRQLHPDFTREQTFQSVGSAARPSEWIECSSKRGFSVQSAGKHGGRSAERRRDQLPTAV